MRVEIRAECLATRDDEKLFFEILLFDDDGAYIMACNEFETEQEAREAEKPKVNKEVFGWFEDLGQPAHDPGMNGKCPICGLTLSAPVVTTSFMVPDDSRSYFYRTHKTCTADEQTISDIEGSIIDQIPIL